MHSSRHTSALSQSHSQAAHHPCPRRLLRGAGRSARLQSQRCRVSGGPQGPCQVDSWLDLMARIPHGTLLHSSLVEMLVTHPEALHSDPKRVCGIVETMLHATVKHRLYSHWTYSPEVLLGLAKDWQPQQLQAAIDALQAVVSVALDGLADVSDLMAACAPDVEPLLLIDKRDLIRKADMLKQLVPEFTPATVFRACPELLLSWHTGELRQGVSRAGDVVVIGRATTAELLLPASHTDSSSQGGSSSLHTASHSRTHTASHGHSHSHGCFLDSAPVAAQPGGHSRGQGPRPRRSSTDCTAQRLLPGSSVRVSRRHRVREHDAPCSQCPADSQQLQQDGDSAPALSQPGHDALSSRHRGTEHVDMFSYPRRSANNAAAPRRTPLHEERYQTEELCVVANSRQLIYVGSRGAEVRFQDPFRQEEAYRAQGGSQGMGGQGFTPRSWLVWPGQGTGFGSDLSSSSQDNGAGARFVREATPV